MLLYLTDSSHSFPFLFNLFLFNNLSLFLHCSKSGFNWHLMSTEESAVKCRSLGQQDPGLLLQEYFCFLPAVKRRCSTAFRISNYITSSTDLRRQLIPSSVIFFFSQSRALFLSLKALSDSWREECIKEFTRTWTLLFLRVCDEKYMSGHFFFKKQLAYSFCVCLCVPFINYLLGTCKPRPWCGLYILNAL